MNADTVSIYLLSPDSDDRTLTDQERQRAASFRFAADTARWIAWRGGLRRVLGNVLDIAPIDVPIVLAEFGKPVLAAPFDALHFSLSHCNDLALVALCARGPVGIDLEPLCRAPDLIECATTFCHPAEIDALPAEPAVRGLRLLEIWTAKEALLKALGTGFSHPPERVCVHFGASVFTATSESPLPGIEEFAIHRLCQPLLAAHCAALAVSHAISKLEIIPPEGSTSAQTSVITLPLSTKSDG